MDRLLRERRSSVQTKVNDSTTHPDGLSEPAWSVSNRFWFVIGYVWAVIMTAIFATGFAVARLLTRSPDVFHFWASRWGRALLLGFGVRAQTTMKSTLDCRRSYVFVANHQNLLDIPILASVLPCSFGFVAKAELERWPFLGIALKMSPSVFVASRDPRRSLESLRRAGQEIREGRSVIIFPEGERTYRSQMVPFKKSAFALAAEARVPVVPVTIVDAYRLMNETRFASRPGRVRVVVHEPMSVQGSSRAELAPFIESVRTMIDSELE